MPICDDPNATGICFLKSDATKPIATRPVFVCRYLTVSKTREQRRIIDQAVETKDNAECWRLLVQAVGMSVTGWKNMGDWPDLESMLVGKLTPDETWELAYICHRAISEDDVKNSELPASSGQAVSQPVLAA